MPTKRQIVSKAYAELGIGSWEFDLQPDEIQDSIDRLDSMMALWSSQGIRVGYNGTSDDPDAETGLPDVAIEAVRTNLALRIAPMLGKQVSGDTRMAASESLSYLTAYFMQVPQRQFPNTLPLGAGNRAANIGGWRTFYPAQGQTVDVGPDSNLTLNP